MRCADIVLDQYRYRLILKAAISVLYRKWKHSIGTPLKEPIIAPGSACIFGSMFFHQPLIFFFCSVLLVINMDKLEVRCVANDRLIHWGTDYQDSEPADTSSSATVSVWPWSDWPPQGHQEESVWFPFRLKFVAVTEGQVESRMLVGIKKLINCIHLYYYKFKCILQTSLSMVRQSITIA